MWNSQLWKTIQDLSRWPVTTQFGARHNALLGYTELAHRRQERDEIETYLRETMGPRGVLQIALHPTPSEPRLLTDASVLRGVSPPRDPL